MPGIEDDPQVRKVLPELTGTPRFSRVGVMARFARIACVAIIVTLGALAGNPAHAGKPSHPPSNGYNFGMWFDGVHISMSEPWQWLNRGNSWYFGNARLTMQNDGNLVLYDDRNGAARWSSRTFGTGATELLFQDDGNLVLYRNDGRAVWHTGTYGNCPYGTRTLLGLQSDSNFVIYCYRAYNDFWPIWATSTVF